MRKILSGLALMVMSAAASAQDIGRDIQSVIQGQMTAFSQGDIATAWTYASPMIQGIFGDVDRFAMMVENGYPMVWQPGEVRYLGLQEQGPWQMQRVQVIDQAGQAHYLSYQMVMIDGEWRINGVALLRAPGVGA